MKNKLVSGILAVWKLQNKTQKKTNIQLLNKKTKKPNVRKHLSYVECLKTEIQRYRATFSNYHNYVENCSIKIFREMRHYLTLFGSRQ